MLETKEVWFAKLFSFANPNLKILMCLCIEWIFCWTTFLNNYSCKFLWPCLYQLVRQTKWRATLNISCHTLQQICDWVLFKLYVFDLNCSTVALVTCLLLTWQKPDLSVSPPHVKSHLCHQQGLFTRRFSVKLSCFSAFWPLVYPKTGRWGFENASFRKRLPKWRNYNSSHFMPNWYFGKIQFQKTKSQP